MIIGVVVVVLCLALWWNQGPLWRLVMLERVSWQDEMGAVSLRGWYYVNRWNGRTHGGWHWLPTGDDRSVATVPSPEPDRPNSSSSANVLGHDVRGFKTVKLETREDYGKSVCWYVDNGFKASEGLHGDGFVVRGTTWKPDGTIDGQIRWPEQGESELKESPPWWWGVQDQTHPIAPWWKEEGR